MPAYLIERYWPGVTSELLLEALNRGRASAEQMRIGGRPVRGIGCILMARRGGRLLGIRAAVNPRGPPVEPADQNAAGQGEVNQLTQYRMRSQAKVTTGEDATDEHTKKYRGQHMAGTRVRPDHPWRGFLGNGSADK